MRKSNSASPTQPVRGAPHSAEPSAEPSAGPNVKHQGKRPKNLTLDPEAVARGEAYGRRHGTNVSQIVNALLKALPPVQRIGSNEVMMLAELSPLTRRLYGIAAGSTMGRNDYRAHLLKKYGSADEKSRR